MNIAEITRKLGTLSLSNFGRRHADRLAAHDRAAISERTSVVRHAVDDLDLAYSARRPLRALWVQATALKDAADSSLDDAIRAIRYDLLGPSHLKGDRGAVAYRALFPDGTIDFITGPDRVELAQVAAMAAYLEANPGHPMASCAADLRVKAAAMAAALEHALRAAQVVEREKREALGRVLRKSGTFLRDQLDGDERQVDGLFPTVAEARVAEADDADGPVEDGPVDG
jgi:glutathione S-transferase